MPPKTATKPAAPAKPNAAASKFNTAAGPRKPAVARASRFAGYDSTDAGQDPIIEASAEWQRVKFILTEESPPVPGKQPYFKTKFEVIESDVHEPGTVVSLPQCIGSTAIAQAVPRIKAMILNALGFPPRGDAIYNEFDPGAQFFELCCGKIDSFVAPDELPEGCPESITPGLEFGPNPLEGIEVYVLVSRGKATKDGTDYFRNCQWAQVGG